MTPRTTSLLESAGALCLGVLASGVLAAGGIWIWQEGASRWQMGRMAESRQIGAPAIPRAHLVRVLKTGLLSGEECARGLAALSPEQIQQLLAEQGPPFWPSNLNAGILLRQAAHALAAHAAPEQVMTEIREILAPQKLDPAAESRLLAAALSGVLEQREVDRAAIVPILRQAGPESAALLLETWFGWTRSPDFSVTMDVIGSAFPDADQKLREDCALAVFRTSFRLGVTPSEPPPQIQWSAAIEKRVIRETAGWFLGSMSDKFLAKLVDEFGHTSKADLESELQDAGLKMADVGSELAKLGLSVDRMIEITREMPAESRDEILSAYLQSLCDDDPRVMSKLARKPEAKNFPQNARTTLARGLIAVSDFEGLSNLLDGASDAEKAKTLDDIYETNRYLPRPELISESAARFYLEHRPSNIAPKPAALATALGALSPEEAEAVAQKLTGLSDKDRREVRETAAFRQAQAVLSDPEKLPKLLAAIPDEIRERALGVIGADSDLAPEMLQRWAEVTSDPKLREELQCQLMDTALYYGSTAGGEQNLLDAIGSAADPQKYGLAVDDFVTARARQDSSQAGAFVEKLPDGPLRDQAMKNLIQEWAKADPIDAGNWLAHQPAGNGRDHAAALLVSDSRDDPQSSLSFAASISDPGLRMRTAAKVMRVWREANPSAVADLLPDAGFSDDEMAQLRTMLRLPPQPPATP